jgi:hypothetical protein
LLDETEIFTTACMSFTRMHAHVFVTILLPQSMRTSVMTSSRPVISSSVPPQPSPALAWVAVVS